MAFIIHNSLFLMKSMQATHMTAYRGKLLLLERLCLFHRCDSDSDTFTLHCFTEMQRFMEIKQLGPF